MWSIWEQRHFRRQADVVVVGAGITGLFTALFHKRRHAGHHVLVLEAGSHPDGATVRNAGFACFGSPSELLADMEAEDPDTALSRVEERWRGLCELRAELGDRAMGFEPTGGHEYFMADDPLYTRVAEGFDRLNDALRPIFGRTVYRWDPDGAARNGLAGPAYLASNDLEGGLDSGALALGLLRKAQSEGVQVRFGARVHQWEGSARGAEVRLADGERISCGQLVLATNGYSASLVPEAGIRPARGQVLVTGPIPGLTLRGTFHAEEGFLYFRDLDGAVLLGGARHVDVDGETTEEHGLNPKVQDALDRFLRERILPGREVSIAHRWSGIMGFPAIGKEAVVRHLGERVVIAAGLSGMGVALGIRVARRAAALVA